MRAHVPQVAADGKRLPFIRGGIAETVVAVKRVVQTTNRLPVLLDPRGGIELGVDHDRVEGRMSEERLDDMHEHVVIQMLGRQDAAAVVGQEHERAGVGSARASRDRDGAQAGTDRLDAERTGMLGPCSK